MRAARDNPAPRPKIETGHRDGERKGGPSLDARSLAQPCYLPEEQHRPLEGERNGETKDSPSSQVMTGQIERRENILDILPGLLKPRSSFATFTKTP